MQKARENSELVEAEIERLENKIRSITEMAINRQDPQFVTGQVDLVASSLVQTEQTMNELQFATGLDPIDDAAPAIIPRGSSVQSQAPVVAEPEPPRRRARQTDDGIKYSSGSFFLGNHRRKAATGVRRHDRPRVAGAECPRARCVLGRRFAPSSHPRRARQTDDGIKDF